ncbi:MAG: rod shape-determining protein MreC [Lachnospiraceae bacterium]|nr:rod shape-determining protein MreC [Lachnospiraceae bacterium]
MRKRNRFRLKNNQLLAVLTFFCIAAIVLTLTERVTFDPIKNGAGSILRPFQTGINRLGTILTDTRETARNKEELIAENEELLQQIEELKEQVTLKEEDEQELERLRELYDLDQNYSEYTKVAAQVISKDPSNWFDSFIINRGTEDGVDVNMNVITSGGLVGIVIEAGSHWASVRSVIDDNSNVSGMTMSTADNCIVSGDLTLKDDGKLSFSQMNTENEIRSGEKIITSNISDKYLPGILIGTIDEVTEDSNHLTKTGTIIPAVDFRHIQEVLVITTQKETGGGED